jgi:hypothetical protein
MHALATVIEVTAIENVVIQNLRMPHLLGNLPHPSHIIETPSVESVADSIFARNFCDRIAERIARNA